MAIEEQVRYWAFISYSSKDRKWGEWLHRRLENYPIPADLQGQTLFDGAVLGRNLRPIFRDRDELAGSADLGAAIHVALEQSRFLVVLCSKNSARSEWVNKEIADFKTMGKVSNILALILDGEPNALREGRAEEECFPPELRYPLEPIAGDLRKEGDGPERGFLKVLAGIAQLDFDKLYRRHERAQAQQRRIRAIAAAAIVAVFASLAGVALWQGNNAVLQKREAEKQRKEAVAQSQEADRQRIQAEAAKSLAQEKELEAIESRKAAEANKTLAERREAEAAATLAEIYNERGRKAEEVCNYGDAAIWYLRSLKAADTPAARMGAKEAMRNRTMEENEYLGHPDEVVPTAFSIDRKSALSGYQDGTLRLWRVDAEQGSKMLAEDRSAVTCVAISPDGKRALSGSFDNTVRLWDLESGRVMAVLLGHRKGITEVAFSADGRQALSGDYEGIVKLWDLQSGRVVSTLSGGWGEVISFAVEPNFKNVLVSYSDGKVRLLELATGKVLQTLLGSTKYARVAFSPHGELAVCVSDDNSIRLWNLHTGAVLYAGVLDWRPVDSGVTMVTFSPDESQIICGFSDATAIFVPTGFTVPRATLINELQQTVDYCLSYDLDVNGNLIPKDLADFYHARYVAARDGKITILPRGGCDYAERWRGTWQRAGTSKGAGGR